MIEQDFLELLHGARIIIVDGDGDMASLLQKRFGIEGFDNVSVQECGEAAVEAVREAVIAKRSFDLMLLDPNLPGELAGKALYEKISSITDVPIVIVSDESGRDTIVDALKSGTVEEYIIKPIDLEVLFLKCERILGRRMFNKHMHMSHRRNQKLFLNVLQVMAKVLEAKDPYTKFHSEKVAKYARQIAKRIGYDERQLELIQIAGILHDFGKIGVNEAVLNKAGGLTDSEYEAIKRHPLLASALLEPIEELRVVIADIRHHHEWWNGSGYPDGLEGEEIPLGARILCVADSYDAMTSKRAYHNPMAEEEAWNELNRCRGSQFDPEVVETFKDVLSENRRRRERISRLREEIL